MQDATQLKTKELLGDSFNLAKERISEILSSQLLFFILMLLVIAAQGYALSEVMEHANQIKAMHAVELAVQKSGGKPDITLINEELGKMWLSFAKLLLVSVLSYFFGRSFIHNLYDGLSKGTAYPRYTLFPVAKNVWRLMVLDLKVVLAVIIPTLMVIILGMIVFFFGDFTAKILKVELPTFLKVIPIVIWSIYILYVFVGRTYVLMAAQPTVYEEKQISLMKQYYPATKGHRWKIFLAKIGAAMPVLIISFAFRILGPKETAIDIPVMMLQQTLVSFFVIGWMIWDVHLNVLLWKQLRKNVPELAA